MDIYPQHRWDLSRFIGSDCNDVNLSLETHRHREFLDTLGHKLGFKTWEDWYQVKSSGILLFM